MFNFLNRNNDDQQYVDCFFCDLKPTIEQSYDFQYSAQEEVHTVKVCSVCAGMLNDIIDQKEANYD